MEKHRFLIKIIDMERTYVYIKFNKKLCLRLGLKIEFKFRKIEIFSVRYYHI